MAAPRHAIDWEALSLRLVFGALAAIAIVHMDEMGASAAAAGMATMIVFTALGAKLLQLLLDRILFTRLQAWRRR